MTLPKKIYPNPIIDALIEIRFTPAIHVNAVFGLLYQALHNEFPNVENLPILQIPEQIRNIDPNLRFKPHYKIFDENYALQIGPDVISIASFPKYNGWEKFSERIFNILNKIEKTGVIKNVLRLGIRYINFFELDIFKNINLNIEINNETINYQSTVIRTEFNKERFTSTLQVANNVSHEERYGSIIDIDTVFSLNLDNFFSEKELIINQGHQIEKQLFFSILKDSFIENLKPEY